MRIVEFRRKAVMDPSSVFFFFSWKKEEIEGRKGGKGNSEVRLCGEVMDGRILEEKNRFSFEQLSNLLQEMGDNEGNNKTAVGS